MSSLLPVTPFNGPVDWDEEPYREDYQSRFGPSGRDFEEYVPAYRYGHELAADARYAHRDWADAETDLRSDWEKRHPDSPWQHFKEAVRHAWERVKT